MGGAVASLAAALERDGIPFCHWKGAAALERALCGERDLDVLVPAADFARALATIDAAGWKRARPTWGDDEPGIAHFFAFEPGVERLLHLHLHDRVLSGEDWINSHTLPFEADLFASTRRAQGVRVPEPAVEAALTVLKHAIRWGSWPDRLETWLRPKDDAAALRGLLAEPALAAAAALVQARVPGIDEGTFLACARALTGQGGARRRLAAEVRRALRPWSRYGPGGRAGAYLRAALARSRRLLDANRRGRMPARGSLLLRIAARDAAQAERAGSELEVWLGQAFRTERRTLAPGEVQLCVGRKEGARVHRIDLAHAGSTAAALRAAAWSLL
jgi:hypothetical protein